MRSFTAALVLVVATIIGGLGWLQQSPAVLWYRISTSALALKAVVTLPQEHVDEFLNSYALFDKEAVTSENDTKHIIGYYRVVNHLCALGDVEKMYIPPVMDQKLGIFQNQMVWEEKGMADKLDVGPGKKVLDVGCGRGRVAHHVASYTGAKVVGLNLDKSQIELAKKFAQEEHMLGEKLDFQEGNYNEPLPFENETFDGLYHVQALTYVEDMRKLFREMNRVLKPGAKISFLDWFVLPAYRPEDPHHRKLLHAVKAVIGAVFTPTPEEYAAALNDTGFEITFSGEASVDGGRQWPLMKQAEKYFLGAKAIVDKLTEWKMLPGHLSVLLDRLNEGGESLLEADQLRLFTTSWQIIAQKVREPLE